MSPKTRTKRTGLRRMLLVGAPLALLALVGVAVLVVTLDGWVAFGRAAQGARRDRMQASAQWQDDGFVNPQPLWNDPWGMLTGLWKISRVATPTGPLPVVTGDRSRFAAPPASGLRVTWLGHSTLFVEIDGARVLVDPVWGPRASPLSWLGPGRFYDPPIALAELPIPDAVVISHDHYDHLDEPTIAAMRDWNTTFIAPLGIGAHLEYWGVPPDRIRELDWWEQTRVGSLDVACTPARHASGRTPFDRDATLWAGYALIGPVHRVYYSGDTGLFPGMREIGERLGPFHVTLIESGAYGSAWPD